LRAFAQINMTMFDITACTPYPLNFKKGQSIGALQNRNFHFDRKACRFRENKQTPSKTENVFN